MSQEDNEAAAKIKNLRTQGNQSFKATDWSQAVSFYSKAIVLTTRVKELYRSSFVTYTSVLAVLFYYVTPTLFYYGLT